MQTNDAAMASDSSLAEWQAQDERVGPELTDPLEHRLSAIEDKLDALLEPLLEAPKTQELQEDAARIDVRVAELAGHFDRMQALAEVRYDQLQRVLVAFGTICRRQDAALERLDLLLNRFEGAMTATEQMQKAPNRITKVTQDFQKTVAEMLLHLKQTAAPQGNDTVERLESLFERFDAALVSSQEAPHGLIQVTQDFEKRVAAMLLHLKQAAAPQSQPQDLEALEKRLLQAIEASECEQTPTVAANLMRHVQIALAELFAETARQNTLQSSD